MKIINLIAVRMETETLDENRIGCREYNSIDYPLSPIHNQLRLTKLSKFFIIQHQDSNTGEKENIGFIIKLNNRVLIFFGKDIEDKQGDYNAIKKSLYFMNVEFESSSYHYDKNISDKLDEYIDIQPGGIFKL